jgi:hypothetical protein
MTKGGISGKGKARQGKEKRRARVKMADCLTYTRVLRNGLKDNRAEGDEIL